MVTSQGARPHVGENAGHKVDTTSLALCFAASLLLRAAAAAGGTLISLYLASLHRSGVQVPARLVGLAAVLFYAAELIGSPAFGVLSDLKGRRTFMALGPIFGGLAIQLVVVWPTLVLVLLARLLQGLSAATSVPSTLSYLSAEAGDSEEVRGRIMSAFEVVTIIGITGGFAAGGVLWDALHYSGFIVVVAIYALSFILFLLVRDRNGNHQGRPSPSVGHLLAFLRCAAALRLIPAWVAVNAVVGLWFSHIDFQMAKVDDPTQLLVGGFSGKQIGIYTALVGLLFVVGIALWAVAFRWLRSTQIMAIALGGLFVLVASILLLNQTEPGEQARIIFLLVLGGLGLLVTSGFTPAALTYLADIAQDFPQTRGALMGLYSVFLGLGQLLGSGIGGYFADWQGVTGMLVFTFVLGVISSVAVAGLMRQERCIVEPTSAAPASF